MQDKEDLINLYLGDCLEVMKQIPDKSIDCIICDLPYGTTACKWDTIIPFELLWKNYNRIIKNGGAIVLFGSEPFSSLLRVSNIKNFKYDWIWNKKLAGNGILAKKQPLKVHEIISVFNSSIYIPQKHKGKKRKKMGMGTCKCETLHDSSSFQEEYVNDMYYPISIQEFSTAGMRKERVHPTQKPVPLIEYLIKTYTKEGDLILDNCMGSGTTGVACKHLNRRFIGIEKEQQYFEIAKKRIEEATIQMTIYDFVR